jgi:hypothetical protein
MLCPKCKEPQHCPCLHCIIDRSKGKVVWKWHPNGEVLECGHCGYAMHADGWLDEEWKQIMEGKEPNSEVQRM